MKYTINLRCVSHLTHLRNLPVSDVLLQADPFCRSGGMELKELKESIFSLKDMGKKCVLSWDCLVKDDELSKSISLLEPFVDHLDSIRYSDPGIGGLLIDIYPDLDLELSLEHGSLNKYAVKSWIEHYKHKLKKVIFSLQMPLDVISTIAPTLRVDTEILAAGPVNIFYSRRSLLGLDSDHGSSKAFTIASDDRPNQLNPIFATAKGSSVFYDKPVNIFSIEEKLHKAGIDYLRFEYLYEHELKEFSECVSQQGWRQATLSYNKDNSIEAYLLNNPTHELFSRLKNKFLTEKNEEKEGLVIEAVKPKYCLINLDVSLNLPIEVKFISPERKTIVAKLDVLHDLKGVEYQNNIKPGTYLCKWHKYVVTGSFIQISDSRQLKT